MEQKKTLFILAAVGIFLVIVIGTACIIYSPAKQATPTVATISPVEKKTSAAPVNTGWTNTVQESPVDTSATESLDAEIENQTIPALTANVKDLVVYSDNTTVYGTPQYQDQTGATTIDLNSLKNDFSAEQSAENKSSNQNINITVNLSETNTTSARTVSAPAAKKETRPAPQPAPASTKVTKAPEAKKTTPAAAPAAKTAEPKKAAPAEKKVVQYWVQVAAFSNKKTAEDARSVLDENKIPSDIFTYKDAKGKMYYRVRVGPYTTKSEGEYWKSRIMKIDQFAKTESYVVSTEN